MKKQLNVGAVIGVAVGLVIVILALVMLGGVKGSTEMSGLPSTALSTSSSFQMKYSFGADFYTEMFGVTYNALQQLIGMSSDNAANLAAVTNKMVGGMHTGFSAVCNLLAWVLLAIGLGTAGISCSRLFVWLPGQDGPAPGPVKDAVPASLPVQPVQAVEPEETPEPIPEEVPEEMPEEISEGTPEEMPEETPEQPAE